jgi:transcription elongation factor GreA
MKRIPITRGGYRNLLKELIYLRRTARPRVLEELQEARMFGIKWENQQYLLAREKHNILLKKIDDLEQKLTHCEIFVGRKYYCKQVGFGTTAVIRNMDTGEQREFQLVGPYEADVSNGKLSIDSPVGRSLLGRCEGEEISVYTPGGIRIYRIVAVEF